MISLWWLALPVLLLPIWWHRQRRERAVAGLLATARFLPRTNPLHRRAWRWQDKILLLLRCLLLAGVIACLADVSMPWRGDAVLVVPGTDAAWVEKQINETGFQGATRIDLPGLSAFDWLAQHEGEWRPSARLLVLGPVSMSARAPHLSHAVTVRWTPAKDIKFVHRIAIVSKRADKWRAMFTALDQPERFVIGDTPDEHTDLIVWDEPQAPPPAMTAGLWWIGHGTAFPELSKAPLIDGVRYADSRQGRLWSSDQWPAPDAETARQQFEFWRRQHFAAVPWPMPMQQIAATADASPLMPVGALREVMTYVLLMLFALERMVTHASRR